MRATNIITCVKHTADPSLGSAMEPDHQDLSPANLTTQPVGNEGEARVLHLGQSEPTWRGIHPCLQSSLGTETGKHITERALVQRVNRRLAKAGQRLRKARPGRTWWRANFGLWSVFEPAQSRVVWHHVDLLAMAKALGVVPDDASMAQGPA
jgi:hypothetical protein